MTAGNLLTVADLAKRWGCAISTVQEVAIRRTGFPPAMRLNGERSWLEDDVSAWENGPGRELEPETEEERARRARPPVCCLYRHFDTSGRLLYVGQSLSFLARLAGHKNSAWFDEIASITIQRFPNRHVLNAAEIAAIRAEGPLHNKAYVLKP